MFTMNVHIASVRSQFTHFVKPVFYSFVMLYIHCFHSLNLNHNIIPPFPHSLGSIYFAWACWLLLCISKLVPFCDHFVLCLLFLQFLLHRFTDLFWFLQCRIEEAL